MTSLPSSSAAYVIITTCCISCSSCQSFWCHDL